MSSRHRRCLGIVAVVASASVIFAPKAVINTTLVNMSASIVSVEVPRRGGCGGGAVVTAIDERCRIILSGTGRWRAPSIFAACAMRVYLNCSKMEVPYAMSNRLKLVVYDKLFDKAEAVLVQVDEARKKTVCFKRKLDSVITNGVFEKYRLCKRQFFLSVFFFFCECNFFSPNQFPPRVPFCRGRRRHCAARCARSRAACCRSLYARYAVCALGGSRRCGAETVGRRSVLSSSLSPND